MPFLADPVFFHSVKRNSGAKRRLIHISCAQDRNLEVTVKEMEKPDWVEIEGIYPGETLRFERGKPSAFIVNVNTTHRFFPKKPVQGEAIRIIFEDGEVLELQISIPEIIDIVEPFRGVFALDFGTTNSCFSFRGGTARVSKALQQAKCSPEIPSAIYFHDVGDPQQPRYSIGMEALFDIRENAGRTYAYLISTKRMLGQDRTLLMLDKLGGVRPGHQQQWHVEDLASFIIRDLLDRAEEELGQRIQHIVATFPPMFSRDRREALQRALLKALRAGGGQADDKSVALDLDEANAAAFHYIYTALLDEFRKDTNAPDRSVDLLAYDFGGGTIDIALVGVKISRTPQNKLSIETELKGLSGDALYGGDNVTLDLFKIVKWRLAVAIARRKHQEIEGRKKTAAKSKTAVDDIWGAPAAKKASDEEDMFSRSVEKKEGKPAATLEEIDPELALIVNRENPAVYENAVNIIAREAEVIEEVIRAGSSIPQGVASRERVRDLAEKRAREIESALETLIPTRFARYENVDPHKENLARTLFHELWYEVDALKIRLSGAEGQPRQIGGVLRKIARYAGIDPIAFSETAFTMEELEKRIEPKIAQTVQQAYKLCENSQSGRKGNFQVAKKKVDPNLRILLFGNSSSLPIVRRKFKAAFDPADANLILNSGQLKTAVAAGACDEYAMRKAFGESGLIHYKPTGFLDRLPYAVGLYHVDLGLIGEPDGFCTLFPRGTASGATKDVSEKTNFLIHPDLRELSIYANYLDGGPPRMFGFIDFTKPLDRPSDAAALAQDAGESDARFRLRIQLLPTREVVATNLQTGQTFGMVLEKMAWGAEENPFAGSH